MADKEYVGLLDRLKNSKLGKSITYGLIAPLGFAYVIGCGGDKVTSPQPTGSAAVTLAEPKDYTTTDVKKEEPVQKPKE